jgi:hypothetical protein
MRTVATVVLALALLVLSATTLIVDSRAGPYRALAEWFETSSEGVRDPRYIARVDRALSDDEIFSLCSREIARSAVSIRLALIDASYRDGDAGAQQAALAKGLGTLTHSLRCYPRDGNFWLRLAMVEFARAGPTTGVKEMLQASLAAAPSDAWVIVPRIEFASRLLGYELGGVEEVLKVDVGNLVSYGEVSDVADLYMSVNEAARSVFGRGFEALDDERLAAIEGAIARRELQAQTKN